MFLFFIRKTIEELKNIEYVSTEINDGFQYTLREINSIVNVNIAVPARIVFVSYIS